MTAAMVTVAVAAINSALGERGRYRLRRILGTGGMASVWLATDARLEREVAVKVLSEALALDESYVLRFKREARLAASLSHPHLVDVFDFGVEDGRSYIVMEYVAGGSLADRLRAEEGAGWDPQTLARELLSAVGHIHAAGIVHRDIKPSNVLFDDDARARVTDFGVAQPPEATELTNPGYVVGTRRYLAPEILHGERATARSDLYSCGVLLSQCLDDHAAPALHSMLARLTAPEPRDRPASAEAALAVAALIVLVIVPLVATGGAGQPHRAHPVRPSSPTAPLSQKLRQLDQAINRSTR